MRVTPVRLFPDFAVAHPGYACYWRNEEAANLNPNSKRREK
jgi:hypothetical protein